MLVKPTVHRMTVDLTSGVLLRLRVMRHGRTLLSKSGGLVLIFATLGLAGCGSSVINKADVETGSRQALTDKVGQQAPPVTCPSDLDAKVGASMVCAITLDGKVYDATVQVDSIDGSTAHYNVQVASSPRPS